MNTPFQVFHSLPAFPCSQRPINTHHQHPPVQLSALRSTQWVSSPGTTSSCCREMPSAERHSSTSDSAGSNRSKVKRKKKGGGERSKSPQTQEKTNLPNYPATGDASLGVIRRQPQASGRSQGFRARSSPIGEAGGPRPGAASASRGTHGPAPLLAWPRLLSAAGRAPPSAAGRRCWTVELPAAPAPAPLFFLLSLPFPPAAAPRCLPARARGAVRSLPGARRRLLPHLCAPLPMAAHLAAAPPNQRAARPSPRSFSERFQRCSGKLPVRARPGRSPVPSPAGAPAPPLPTCQGEGALPVLPRRLAVEPGEGGKESRITSSSGSAVPGVHTHTFTCTDLKVQFRQADGGTGKRGESSLDQTCHKRRTSK